MGSQAVSEESTPTMSQQTVGCLPALSIFESASDGTASPRCFAFAYKVQNAGSPSLFPFEAYLRRSLLFKSCKSVSYAF